MLALRKYELGFVITLVVCVGICWIWPVGEAVAVDCNAWKGGCDAYCIFPWIQDYIYPQTWFARSSQQGQCQMEVRSVTGSCGEVWAVGLYSCPVQTGWYGNRSSSQCTPV